MTTMQPTSWREERRRDREHEAQIARDDAAAAMHASVAASEARARLKRERDLARAADAKAARRQRAARWAARTAWLRSHVTDLLFVPVILVPGTLAWSAMAAYGHDLFGVVGYALPAFSEGGMWAFEATATWTARHHPERPVWHFMLGALVFAAIGAGLNFLHGITVIPGHPHGVTVGAVMAIISAAGLVAHQIVNLGPRRTRADRAAARLKRAAERRAQAFRRIALRGAIASLDADGNARVRIRPGAFTLGRRHGRARLEPVTPSPVWLPWPMVLPGTAEPAATLLLDVQAAAAVAAYRSWHSVFAAPPVRPVAFLPKAREAVSVEPPAARQLSPVQTAIPVPAATAKTTSCPPAKTAPSAPAKTVPASLPNSKPKIPAAKRQKALSTPSEKRAEAERLLRADPRISNVDLVRQSGVSERTAARIRREMPRHLHVAQG